MIRPHGGKPVERTLAAAKADLRAPSIAIDSDLLGEIENICHGVFHPLSGFMRQDELQGVLDDMRLPGGAPWTIPILLPVDEGTRSGELLSLVHHGKAVGEMTVEDVYSFDRDTICQKTFGTSDPAHPGVAEVMASPGRFAGGRVALFSEIKDEFSPYYLKPIQTRAIFSEKGWKRVVGFQTRNVPHIGHEHVQREALGSVDGLFINPVIGKKKAGDFRDSVIIRAYQKLISHSLPNAVLGILRTKMRYAGPKEAIFHAIIRKNFGCTHFIVGRDHAGVGKYYPPYAAQEIFGEFDDLGITPIFFRTIYFCHRCDSVVSGCDHPPESHMHFSGTRLREKILKKENPDGMLRKEILDVILEEENPFV
jgi:sulfate adenylyltransferase